jgi:hypothetical protein
MALIGVRRTLLSARRVIRAVAGGPTLSFIGLTTFQNMIAGGFAWGFPDGGQLSGTRVITRLHNAATKLAR